MGEESYYIDLISDYIVDNVLTDTEKEFNLTVVYGADVDIATVINAAKRYPMMSERQVVVVKEAQAIRNMEVALGSKSTPLRFMYEVMNAGNWASFTFLDSNRTPTFSISAASFFLLSSTPCLWHRTRMVEFNGFCR